MATGNTDSAERHFKESAAQGEVLGHFNLGQSRSSRSLRTVTNSTMPGTELDVLAVDRKENVLTVKWAVRNDRDEPLSGQFGLTGRNPHTFVRDEKNGKSYYVLQDERSRTLASQHTYLGADTYGIGVELAPRSTGRYWMKFAAPPLEVETVTLFFDAADEPLEDLSIRDL